MDEIIGAREIDLAMREVARRRDEALNTAPALSPARRAALTAMVARQFPVEEALYEAAAKRDQALPQIPAKIPAAVESILERHLVAAEATSGGRDAAMWLSQFRLPLATALAACALITAALLALGRWEDSRRDARNRSPMTSVDRISVESAMEPFTRLAAIGPFNLNNPEPASLQVSFLANSRIRFADGNNAPLGLRLDLPVKAALMEDELARTH